MTLPLQNRQSSGSQPIADPEKGREATDAQKSRKGLNRLWHATRYSIAGLRTGWHQAAFRAEVFAAALLLPGAFWVGEGWVETGVLVASVVLVMIVELLNTGVELAIDRVGLDWHPLSKQAKDLGSAAVLLSLLLCGGLWAAALFHRFS